MPTLTYVSGKVMSVRVLTSQEIRVTTDNTNLGQAQIFPTTGAVSGEYHTQGKTATVNDPQTNFTSLKTRLEQQKATRIKIGYDASVAGDIKPVYEFSFSAVLLGASPQPTDAALPR